MRQAEIHFKGERAGLLSQWDNGQFTFEYDKQWKSDTNKSAIALNFPKIQSEFTSEHLFPLFFNMLPEGSNKKIVCEKQRIDEDDLFSLLLITAEHDSIGAITVKKVE